MTEVRSSVPPPVEHVVDPPGLDGSEGLLAIVIRGHPIAQASRGCLFVTGDAAEQQVAFMRYPQGGIVPKHYHPFQPRLIQRTCETLVVLSGKFRICIANCQDTWGRSFELGPGSVVVISAGSHSLVALEEGSELMEVKQGPYRQDHDKVLLPHRDGGDLGDVAKNLPPPHVGGA